MYIKIHRGTSQIGGNIIEIGTKNTRLIFDAGSNLPSLDKVEIDSIEIEGLTCGKPAFDWVFISHHHNDHSGLINRILPGIPIFAGKETKRILSVISDFTDTKMPLVNFHFTNCQPIQLNDMRVTPIGVDHSAKDAYMFLIQGEGKNILYTGDYRAVEETATEIKRLLGISGKLDVLITEGTNIGAVRRGNGVTLRNEEHIQVQTEKLMQQYDGTVFVLCSSTNEQRVQAIHAAARNTGRTVCEDLFMTAVRNQPEEEQTLRFVANFVSEQQTPRTYHYFAKLFQDRELLSGKSLAKIPGKKVVFVRTSMLKFLQKYLKNRPPEEQNLLIYSMWEGYKKTEPVQKILFFCKEQGIDVVDLHCSGHAYRHAIQDFIRWLKPEVLIPIHCDEKDRTNFNNLHDNCMMLQDGERLEL